MHSGRRRPRCSAPDSICAPEKENFAILVTSGVVDAGFDYEAFRKVAEAALRTGKKFSLAMCTVGHWKDGVMIEEWLFWDSATDMKQMGIGN
jgi:hypothetical protein